MPLIGEINVFCNYQNYKIMFDHAKLHYFRDVDTSDIFSSRFLFRGSLQSHASLADFIRSSPLAESRLKNAFIFG